MHRVRDSKIPDDNARIKKIIEGILFITETPMKVTELSQFLEITERKTEKIIKAGRIFLTQKSTFLNSFIL